MAKAALLVLVFVVLACCSARRRSNKPEALKKTILEWWNEKFADKCGKILTQRPEEDDSLLPNVSTLFTYIRSEKRPCLDRILINVEAEINKMIEEKGGCKSLLENKKDKEEEYADDSFGLYELFDAQQRNLDCQVAQKDPVEKDNSGLCSMWVNDQLTDSTLLVKLKDFSNKLVHAKITKAGAETFIRIIGNKGGNVNGAACLSLIHSRSGPVDLKWIGVTGESKHCGLVYDELLTIALECVKQWTIKRGEEADGQPRAILQDEAQFADEDCKAEWDHSCLSVLKYGVPFYTRRLGAFPGPSDEGEFCALVNGMFDEATTTVFKEKLIQEWALDFHKLDCDQKKELYPEFLKICGKPVSRPPSIDPESSSNYVVPRVDSEEACDKWAKRIVGLKIPKFA